MRQRLISNNNLVRPDQSYHQNSDDLAGISHMCLLGCNFMTSLQVAQREDKE